MTLKTWLILFILSMAVNAEVLAWAVRSGQFSRVNRGNLMPLRSGPPRSAPRRRPWAMACLLMALAVIILVWADSTAVLVMEALGR